jgi:hypothetical protein
MTGGVSIEYAHARTSARLGARPDDRLWHQLRASRSVRVLLDAVRASPAAAYVSGIEPLATVEAIELALRQQFRLRVDELARWAPDPWFEAVRWTRPLVDLPALAHLASGEPVVPWMRVDPELAPYAGATLPERRAALLSGPLSTIAAALMESSEPRGHGANRVQPALEAWQQHWRGLWPAVGAEERANLDAVARLLAQHERNFVTVQPDEADAARLALASRLSGLMRRAAAQPAALFAWLALLALDLERLRGVFIVRALQDTGAL